MSFRHDYNCISLKQSQVMVKSDTSTLQTCSNIGASACGWTCSHLGRFLARLTVQAAYPSAFHHLVVSGVRLHLLPLKCCTVTGFQIGLLHWGFILRWSFNGLHWFHILICLKLSPNKYGKTNKGFYSCSF